MPVPLLSFSCGTFQIPGRFHSRDLRGRCGPRRRGAVVVMAAVMMVMLLAMVAFAIDTGYMLSVRTELQRAADAGAMAGAGALVGGKQAAKDEAFRFVQMNKAGARELGKKDVTIELGEWNKASKTFTLKPDDPSAVRVAIEQPKNSMFFARVLGQRQF